MEGTAPPQASAVGECYLEMFFSKLFEAPRDVHRFYKNPSQLTIVFTDEPSKEVSARGQKQVNDLFVELDFLGWEAPETLRQVTYQETFNHSVLIHHNSVLRHAASGRSRKVSQTILLAVEPDSPSYDHYFVLNDILVLSPVETDAPAEEPIVAAAEPVTETVAETVAEPEPVAVAEQPAVEETPVEPEPVVEPVPAPVAEPVVEETPAPIVEETPAVVAAPVVPEPAPVAEEPTPAPAPVPVPVPALTPAPVEPAAPKAAPKTSAAGPTPAQAAKIVRPQEPVQTGPPSFAQLVRKNLPTNFVPVPQPEAVNPPAPLPVVEKKHVEAAAAGKKPYTRSADRPAESSRPNFDFSVHIPELPAHANKEAIEKLIHPLVAGKIQVRTGESTTYANIFVSNEKLMKSVSEAVQANKAYFEGFELKAIERKPRPAQANGNGNGNGDARPKPRTTQKSQTPK